MATNNDYDGTADYTERCYRDAREVRYQVIEHRTGAVIGTYRTKERARRKADTMDSQYGAYGYFIRVTEVY